MVKTNHELSRIHKRSKLHALVDDLIKLKRFIAFFIDMSFCGVCFFLFLLGISIYFDTHIGLLSRKGDTAFILMFEQNFGTVISTFLVFSYIYQVVCSTLFKKTFAFYVLGLNFKSKPKNVLGYLLRPIGIISFIPINSLLIFNLKSTKYLQDLVCEIDIVNNLSAYGDFINVPDEAAFQASIDISSLKEYEELLDVSAKDQEAA